MVYLISFESNEMLHDYTKVVEIIKSMGDYQHPMTTLWFLRTETYCANDIYTLIKPLLKNGDHIFVTALNNGEQSDRQGWLSKSFWKWMHNE